MTYESGTKQTLREIKKELEPFVDIHKDIKKFIREQERINRKRKQYEQYKKQQRKIRLQKWEDRINWLSDKIKEHKQKKYDIDENEVSKDTTNCRNCNAQFVDEKIPVTFMCSNCHNLIKKSEKCPRCGAWFINPKMDDDKKNLLNALDKDIRKDNWQKLTKEELASEIKIIISLMNNNYKNVKKYVSKKSNEFDVKKFISYQKKIDNLNKKVFSIENKIEQDLNKTDSLKYYSKVLNLYYQSIKLHKEMIGCIIAELKVTGHEIRSKNASIILEHDVKENFNFNNDYNFDSPNNDVDYEEEQADNKGDIIYNELEDWQKREVDEDNYDSYNFEEDELEDDDYYYEDDKE